MPDSQVRVEYVRLSDIKLADKNPKRHDVPVIEQSMARWGYTMPMLVDDKTGKLVAGQGRYEALTNAKKLGRPVPARIAVDTDGEWLVPVLRGIGFENPSEASAYLLADNQLTENGGWDSSELTALLQELSSQDPSMIVGTGFSLEEIEKMVGMSEARAAAEDEPPPDAAVLEALQKKWGTAKGQKWRLGDHILVCGDSTDMATLNSLMDGERASICWTDPPYNVSLGTGFRQGTGLSWKKHVVIENDSLGDDFGKFIGDAIKAIYESLCPGGMLYMAMSAQEWALVDRTLRDTGFHWSSTIIWVKNQFVVQRKDYHTQYEPIWYGWRADAGRVHELLDRTQSDTWFIDRPKKSEAHPTMKPTELVRRALFNSSGPGDIVLDPFCGSGTTLLVSEEMGRRCRAVELVPGYVATIMDRWVAQTGKVPELIDG